MPCAGSGGRSRTYGPGFSSVSPVAASTGEGIEEQEGQLHEEQFGMDKRVDPPFPPLWFAPAMFSQPTFVGCPMTGLVLPDDPEDLHEHRVALYQRMFEQDLHLPVSAPFRQGDHAAKLLEQAVVIDHRLRIEIVDALAKDDLDKAINVCSATNRMRIARQSG